MSAEGKVRMARERCLEMGNALPPISIAAKGLTTAQVRAAVGEAAAPYKRLLAKILAEAQAGAAVQLETAKMVRRRPVGCVLGPVTRVRITVALYGTWRDSYSNSE
jgi:hypothetical protein